MFDLFNFIHAALDAPDAPDYSFAQRLAALDAPFSSPPPESHVIAPFTLIFSVELPLNSRLLRLV